jgi:DNA-binding HxlR family transcriptional regulator
MKSYGIEDCPVARTLDLIGERWTILLLRDLLRHGPRRFQDFQASLPGVAPNTLSARLKALEDSGLVSRALYNERPPRLEYVLTAKGKSLGPIVKAMRDWGNEHLDWERPRGEHAAKTVRVSPVGERDGVSRPRGIRKQP